MGESCARERRARLIQPIDYFLVAWFVLVAISTIWVGVDQFRHNPEPAVMKWGLHPGHPLPGADRGAAVCARGQGAAAGRA